MTTDTTMLELTAAGWYAVRGHNRCASISTPWPGTPEDHTPERLRGQRVKIDGVEHTVVAVETYSIFRSPEHPYRRGYSLMLA